MTLLIGLICPAMTLVGYGILFSAAVTPYPNLDRRNRP